MTKVDAIKRMLDRASDRYGDNHPLTEALARQYYRVNSAAQGSGSNASQSALTD